MANLYRNQHADVELQIGSEVYQCEVVFNYMPASPGSQFEPAEDEYFEITSLTAVQALNGENLDLEFLIYLLSDEIIKEIKEQKEG